MIVETTQQRVAMLTPIGQVPLAGSVTVAALQDTDAEVPKQVGREMEGEPPFAV